MGGKKKSYFRTKLKHPFNPKGISHDTDGNVDAGQAYAFWGKTGFGASRNLDILGDTGVTIKGIKAGDLTGWSVDTAGDVNGDGKSDLLIGAWSADAASDAINAGVTYVVFGASKSEFGQSMDLVDLDGTNGCLLYTSDAADE